MASAFDVIGIGENSVDQVYTIPAWPRPGSPDAKQSISDAAVRFGGQVATALCVCAGFGLRAGYIGCFGNDENGAALKSELERRGVDTRAAVVRRAPNRHAVILVDASRGERVVLWRRDPALALSPDELPAALIRSARVLHVDNVDEAAAAAAARIARSAGADVTTDIDAVGPDTLTLVAEATVPIFAAHAPSALTGEPDLEHALRRLRRPHHRMLCVTLGADGAALMIGDRLHHVPPFSVVPVDTTGAGDIFRGAFIYALLQGMEPHAIVRFANAAAAVSCTRPGAIDSAPTLDEVQALLGRS